MSKLEIYAVWDDACQCYQQIIPFLNEKVARMTFESLFKSRRLNIPMLYDYPNSFCVRRLGVFDDNQGLFVNCDSQVTLLDFGTLIESKPVLDNTSA